MRKIIFFTIALLSSMTIWAQSFEYNLTDTLDTDGTAVLRLQLREVTGTGTPTTADQIFDLTFGIKWPEDCANNFATLNAFNNNPYRIEAGSNVLQHDGYNYQAFSANFTPYNFPNAWSASTWTTIIEIAYDNSCAFEMTEPDFVQTTATGPNISIIYEGDNQIEHFEPSKPVPPGCPDTTDVTVVNETNTACSEATVTLTAPTIIGDYVANATYTWSLTVAGNSLGVVATEGTTTVTLPVITGCDAQTATYTVSVGCDSDNTIAIDGGSSSYTVHPTPNAPTVNRNDATCTYTVIPACVDDVVSPDMITDQTPGTVDFTQNFAVTTVNGCADNFDVLVEGCPTVSNSAWKIQDQTIACNASDFKICIEAEQAVDQVVGVDLLPLRHASELQVIGITYGDLALAAVDSNTNHLSASFNESAAGVTNISMNIDGGPAPDAYFSGTGVLFCIDFVVATGFEDWDNALVTPITLEESTSSFAVIEKTVDLGATTVSNLAGYEAQLLYRGDSLKPLVGELEVRYCTSGNQESVNTDNEGKVQIDVNNEGISFHIPQTHCAPVNGGISATDASRISKIIVNSINYTLEDLLAADVTGDGKVRAGDRNAVGQRTIGDCYAPEAISGNTSDWKFYHADTIAQYAAIFDTQDHSDHIDQVPTATHCFETNDTMPDVCTYLDLSVVAILRGDVTGNWNTNTAWKNIIIGQMMMNVGQAQVNETTNIYQIPVYYLGNEEVEGMSLSIHFDTTKLVYIEASKAAGLTNNDALADNEAIRGQVLVSAYATDNFIEPTDAPLFFLHFQSEVGVQSSDFFDPEAILDEQSAPLEITAIQRTHTPLASTDLQIVPNPATQQTVLDYQSHQNKTVHIQVYDLTGKQVKQYTNLLPNGQQTIDVSHLSAGIYLVELATEQGLLGREKLVVVH